MQEKSINYRCERSGDAQLRRQASGSDVGGLLGILQVNRAWRVTRWWSTRPMAAAAAVAAAAAAVGVGDNDDDADGDKCALVFL